MVLQGAFQEDEDSEMLPGMDDVEVTGYLGETLLAEQCGQKPEWRSLKNKWKDKKWR